MSQVITNIINDRLIPLIGSASVLLNTGASNLSLRTPFAIAKTAMVNQINMDLKKTQKVIFLLG